MRVLHVISGIDAAAGGPAVALAGLASAQVQEGLEVSIAASWVAGTNLKIVDTLRERGVKVHLIGPCRRFLCWHPQIKPWIDQLVSQSDIVHVHALFEEVQHQAPRAARRRRIPYIMRPCGMLDPWSLNRSKWRKRLYMMLRLRTNLNRAAAIHFTADEERDLTRPLGLKAPAIVEPNGVNLDEFETLPPPGSFRARHSQIGQRRILLFLSRIHPKKGLDVLIPAFARLGLDDVMLVIAGPDNDGYQAEIQTLIDRAGVGERVLFTGMLRGAERVAALAEARLFVLPSYQENFGIAVVEALAAGTPVVISDQVNIQRQIQQARVGGVVPLDVDALAVELRRWLGNDDLCDEAARRARPFVWENYDWRQIARRWAARYRELTAG